MNYLDKLLEDTSQQLILPQNLRTALSKPMGKLYSRFETLEPEKQLKLILKDFKGVLVTVGDVVTDSMLSVGVLPSLSIIDEKTLRGSYKGHFIDTSEQIRVLNPPASITYLAWKKIKEVLKQINQSSKSNQNQKNHIMICVDGEEDLLVIPCVLEAPEGSLILYGQPRQGIVAVTVTNSIKDTVYGLIQKFEKNSSVQS